MLKLLWSKIIIRMDSNWIENSVDPGQLASDEASWSWSTLFSKERIEIGKKQYAIFVAWLILSTYAFINYFQFNDT